jgi:hypothetical protein
MNRRWQKQIPYKNVSANNNFFIPMCLPARGKMIVLPPATERYIGNPVTHISAYGAITKPITP